VQGVNSTNALQADSVSAGSTAGYNLVKPADFRLGTGSNGQALTTDGNSNLAWSNVSSGSGSSKYTVTQVNAGSYAIQLTDQLITVGYNGTVNITLPAASSNTVGQVFNIKDTLGANRTGNSIGIASIGSDTLDGGTIYISNPYNSWTIVGLTATSWGVI